MALFKITIRKGFFLVGETVHWTNVYRVEAADIPDALDKGVTIANIEQAVLKDYVFMSKVTARLDVPATTETGSRLLTGAGDVTGDTTLRLPNWNVIRIVFTDDVGRPDQKYFRCPLQEDEIESGTLLAPVVNDMSLNYAIPITELEFIRSSDNVPYTGAQVVPAIQMRQTSWHRRARPGFHRAYVPN